MLGVQYFEKSHLLLSPMSLENSLRHWEAVRFTQADTSLSKFKVLLEGSNVIFSNK